MAVIMRLRRTMWYFVMLVTVRMYVRPAIGMAMDMDMDFLSQDAENYTPPKNSQHRANSEFEPVGDTIVNLKIEEQDHATEDHQRDGMSYTPGRAMRHDLTRGRFSTRQTGDSRNVIGFKRVLHAEEETQPQN